MNRHRSVSLQGAASTKSEEEHVIAQRITAITDTGAEAADPNEQAKGVRFSHAKDTVPVIPVTPGRYEQHYQHRKAQPSFVPESNSLQADPSQAHKTFVKAEHNDASNASAQSISYGFNSRTNKRKRDDGDYTSAPVVDDRNTTTMTHVDSIGTQQVQLVDELQQSLQSLPDAAPEEAYTTMPVEQFGEAMLRGMGWQPGQQLNKHGRKAPKPAELEARSSRLGLGASSAAGAESVQRERSQALRKPGDARDEKHTQRG